MKRAVFWRLMLIAAVAALICSAAALALEQQGYEDDLRDHMYIVLHAVEQSPPQAAGSDALAHRVAALYGMSRVTVIAADGTVLGDSEADYKTMENHANRPEVRDALATGQGFSIRRSATLETRMLYAAVRRGDGGVLRGAVPMRDVSSRSLQYGWLTALVVLVALLAALFVASRFSHAVLRPVERMAEDVAVIQGGDLSHRLGPARYDELAPLVTSVNALGDTVRDSITQLRNERDKLDCIFNSITQGIVIVEPGLMVAQINKAAVQFLCGGEKRRDARSLLEYTRDPRVTEAVDACLHGGAASVFDVEDEQTGRILGVSVSPIDGEWVRGGALILLSDRTQERRLQAMRREFFANASHELKTPITSIRGFAELISSGLVTDPERINDAIARIREEADRVSALVSDILTLSSLEEPGGGAERERVNVYERAQEVLHSLAPQAAEAGVTLSLEGGEAYVEAPPGDIRRLLENLVENAVKYNTPGGFVRVTIRARSGECVLSVRDSGIGIPPRSIPRIFERFYRADPGRSRQTGGTGLGLAIVKHIVSSLGGEVSVTSTRGAGTEFVVTLPAAGQV